MKKKRIRNSVHVVIVFFCFIQAILWYKWHQVGLLPPSDANDAESSWPQYKVVPSARDFVKSQSSSKHKKLPLKSSLYALRTQNATLVHTLARPFSRWNRPFPCFPAESDMFSVPALRRPMKRGFMYFKARKAGSSTIAGIALRIARSMAAASSSTRPNSSVNTTTICNTRFGHPPAWYNEYSRRDLLHSYLWTILREPTKRHVSEFYHFAVSRFGWEPTDANFKYYFQQQANDIDNYYLYFLKTDVGFDRQHGDIVEAVQSIMRDYNFIGILERLDESLVVLQMLLNLKTSDILYLRSKVHGGFDDGVFNETCVYIKQSYVSPSMQEWLESSEYWHNYTRGDNLLYATAYKSLDLTIDNLGRAEFDLLLKTFRNALEIASQKCQHVVFPCSPEGIRNEHHDCLWTDSGCGFECLDEVARELGI